MLKKNIKVGQQKIEKYIKNNRVPLITKLYTLFLYVLRPVYFSNEFLLINGLKRKVSSNQQSIIFFTVHKAASTFIKNTAIKLLGNDNIQPINLSGYLSGKKQQKYYTNSAFMAKILKPKGYFFGAIRAYYHFPAHNNYKILLVLRDPRDVLTSHYFSTLFNHPLSRKEVMREREQYKNTDIDEFVLGYAPILAKKYEDYSNYLLGKENVLFLKYEDMITAFPAWLHKLASFMGVLHKEELIKEIINNTTFKVAKENPNSFIRNIKAGDHMNKLKPETIKVLNSIFSLSMSKFGYVI